MHESRRCGGFLWINIHVYINTVTTSAFDILYCRTHNLQQNTTSLMKSAKCMNSWGGLKIGYLFSNWLPYIFQIAQSILNGFPISWPYRAHSAYRQPCNSSGKMWKILLPEFTFVVYINFSSTDIIKVSPWQQLFVYEEVNEEESGSVWMWCAQGWCRQKIGSPAPGRSNYICAPINQFACVCVCMCCIYAPLCCLCSLHTGRLEIINEFPCLWILISICVLLCVYFSAGCVELGKRGQMVWYSVLSQRIV